MSKVIDLQLSASSVDSAIKQIEEYKADLLRKCERFVEEVIKEGITVAKYAVSHSEYGSYISFSQEIRNNKNNIVGIMYASNNGIIVSEWLQKDGSTRVANVSPLLMAEFGAGRYASNPKGVEGVGRGTFPGQIHADQPGWWYATGTPENKVWHYSGGVAPDQPMWKASNQMMRSISQIARRIFTT